MNAGWYIACERCGVIRADHGAPAWTGPVDRPTPREALDCEGYVPDEQQVMLFATGRAYAPMLPDFGA